MDRIELAERRYRQIVPEPVQNWAEMPVRELGIWLKDYVAPLVGEYTARPRFRDAACWSLHEFRAGANTPARRQVDATAAALTRHARLLRAALRSRRVATAIKKSLPPLRLVEREEMVVTGAGVQPISRTMREVDQLPVMTAQIEAIARPFWRDLVDPADYLEPRGAWLLRDEPSEHVTAGEFVVSLNPELHSIGDFISRCLFRRVEVLAEILESADRAVLACVPALGRAAPKSVAEVAGDRDQLRETVRQLHTICGPDDEAAVRGSCVILAQVYAAFHPAPDVGWLGLPDDILEVGRHTLRHRFTNARNPELTESVAVALGDLRRLYANEPPGQSALEEAVARGGLVLTMSPCAAYWAKKPLAINWANNDRPWKMLLVLARKGRLASTVEERDLFPNNASPSAMPNLCARLKKLLPAELRKQILPGDEPRSYRLKLESAQIVVIDKPA